MDRKSILKRFIEELEESHQNYLDGKCKPIEELDWSIPWHIAEPRSEYRVESEA